MHFGGGGEGQGTSGVARGAKSDSLNCRRATVPSVEAARMVRPSGAQAMSTTPARKKRDPTYTGRACPSHTVSRLSCAPCLRLNTRNDTFSDT